MLKHIVYLLFTIIVSTDALCQGTGYTHAKEIGLKGKIKTMKEYGHEAYKGDDSNFHKRSGHYYSLSVTDFNEPGNIVTKTEYAYNTNYALTPAQDSITSISKTVYSYNGAVCTGYTRYRDNVRTTLCERTMRGDYCYTDSVYAFIQPGDKQSQLTEAIIRYFRPDYTEDSTHRFKFYDIETGSGKDSKKITVYLTPAGRQESYSMQWIEDKHPKKDIQGNRLEDVYVYFEGDKKEYEISTYEYEYY